MLTHCQIQNGVGRGTGEGTPPPGEAQNYRVSLPKCLL